ncbi:methionyl-tRNA formyltransferase [Paralimibaculum aggregatum]|nr:methionyl-tRNA formyltransferase [Limibaculum sp. NKW23]
MRLIVMGQQAFGKDALAKILEAGKDEVVAVYCAPDKEGKPVDPLKEFALEQGLPVFQPANFKDEAVLEQLRAHDADLMVMAYVIIFVPEAARDIPKLGSICFHPSILPLHRGPSAVNWPIIWGSTKSGFSWFYPTDGLDEGDLLLTWECEIGPDDTVIDLYFKKIYPAGVDSVLEVCDLFRSGNPPRMPQDESKATYESWCRKKDAEINWQKPAAEVYNLIRGTNPAPGAWTTWNGEQVQIYDSRRAEGEGSPGEVVSVSEDGVTVQAAGGRILVKRVRPQGAGKIQAAEWAAQAGIAAGAKLGA